MNNYSNASSVPPPHVGHQDADLSASARAKMAAIRVAFDLGEGAEKLLASIPEGEAEDVLAELIDETFVDLWREVPDPRERRDILRWAINFLSDTTR